MLAYAKVWHHVDASGRTLGKLADRIAIVLMGKNKPIFDPSGTFAQTCGVYVRFADTVVRQPVDCGDYVVVTNAKNVVVSGNKVDQKMYYHHSMYPGGLKERRYKDLLKKNPDEVSWTASNCSAFLCSMNVHERS